MATAQNIEIKFLENPVEDWRLLVDGFCESKAIHPTMSGIAEFQTEQGKEKLALILKELTHTTNCPIIIAFDPERKQVAGSLFMRGIDREIAKLPRSAQPGCYNFGGQSWSEQTKQEMKNVLKFSTPHEQEMEVWVRNPDIDSFAVILAFSVREEYGQRGLGLRMVKKSLETLREMGYPLVFGSFTCAFSQKIAAKCGFTEVRKKKYEGEFLNYEKTPETVRKLHTHHCTMEKRLSGC